MKVGVMLPVGDMDAPADLPTRWADVRAVAQTAEEFGLDSVWIADHLLAQMQDGTVHGMHDAWTLLSAVAAVTTRVELGPLVLCSSFRDPGVVAKMAATLDEVSGGRLVLGLGAGWHDPEYEAFGFPSATASAASPKLWRSSSVCCTGNACPSTAATTVCRTRRSCRLRGAPSRSWWPGEGRACSG